MEPPVRPKATIQYLQSELASLKRIADEIAKVGDRQLDPWLENVKSTNDEVVEIEKESDEIYRAFDSTNLSRRDSHNMKMTESLKAVAALKERAVEIFLQGMPQLNRIRFDKLRRFTRDALNSLASQTPIQVGSGGFGAVYRGQLANGVPVAIKVLKLMELTEETFMIELKSMLVASHSNIIQLYGYCSEANMKALVYEFMDNGSLKDLFQNPNLLKWQTVYAITIQIAKALAYLHHDCGGQIIHHDVKPSNVLLDTHFTPKIADFGATRIINENMSRVTISGYRGTPGYTAPEVNEPLSKVSYKSDVYSFGVILFDVLVMRSNITNYVAREQVWNGFDKGNLDQTIKKYGILEEDAEKARILAMVALWCIHHTPERRPSMKNVVTALEKEMQVERPTNPFYASKENFSMLESQDVMNSSIPSSTCNSNSHQHLITLPSSGMENPSGLVENWVILSKKMDALKKFRDEVARKKAWQMASWLENVNTKVEEFEALKNELAEFSPSARKVLDILRSVEVLHEVGNATATLLNDLTVENQRRFTRAELESFTSGFSIPIDPNENVYKGELPSRVQIVVKKLTEQDVVEEIFMAEMNAVFKTSHRNLVKLHGFCFEKSMKALVFEYMPNGSLDRILFDRHHGNMEWEKLYEIATETAKGISYLHDGCELQLLHQDLKPSNVLLDSKMCPKVTNFGVSKLMSRDKTHLTVSKVTGHPSYAAPEMMQSLHITHKCDVYSFGMMLFEVLGKRRVVEKRVYFPKLIWNKFVKREVEGILKECGIKEKNREKAMILCMVAFWCIQYTPENRPSMSIVVKMLEKEIKVTKPPIPFSPSQAYSVKPFVDVVYDPSSDFEAILFD